MARRDFKEYADFLRKVGHGKIDGVDVTHDGYPLSLKEAKFIDLFIATGNLNQSLKEAGMTYKTMAGKDYISDEIIWRLDQLKKATIADADEIMQYLTKVMRGEEKDQFGLDAPLSERTAAAKELARRNIEAKQEVAMAVAAQAVPELKVTLNWDGMKED